MGWVRNLYNKVARRGSTTTTTEVAPTTSSVKSIDYGTSTQDRVGSTTVKTTTTPGSGGGSRGSTTTTNISSSGTTPDPSTSTRVQEIITKQQKTTLGNISDPKYGTPVKVPTASEIRKATRDASKNYRLELSGYASADSLIRQGHSTAVADSRPSAEQLKLITDREKKLNENVLTVNLETLKSNQEDVKKNAAYLTNSKDTMNTYTQNLDKSTTAFDTANKDTLDKQKIVEDLLKGKTNSEGYFTGSVKDFNEYKKAYDDYSTSNKKRNIALGNYEGTYKEYSALGNKRERAYDSYVSKSTIKSGFGTGKFSRDVNILNFKSPVSRPVRTMGAVIGSTTGSVLGGVGESLGKEGGYYTTAEKQSQIYTPQFGTQQIDTVTGKPKSGYSNITTGGKAIGSKAGLRKAGEVGGDIGGQIAFYTIPGVYIAKTGVLAGDIAKTKQAGKPLTKSQKSELVETGAVVTTVGAFKLYGKAQRIKRFGGRSGKGVKPSVENIPIKKLKWINRPTKIKIVEGIDDIAVGSGRRKGGITKVDETYDNLIKTTSKGKNFKEVQVQDVVGNVQGEITKTGFFGTKTKTKYKYDAKSGKGTYEYFVSGKLYDTGKLSSKSEKLLGLTEPRITSNVILSETKDLNKKFLSKTEIEEKIYNQKVIPLEKGYKVLDGNINTKNLIMDKTLISPAKTIEVKTTYSNGNRITIQKTSAETKAIISEKGGGGDIYKRGDLNYNLDTGIGKRESTLYKSPDYAQKVKSTSETSGSFKLVKDTPIRDAYNKILIDPVINPSGIMYSSSSPLLSLANTFKPRPMTKPPKFIKPSTTFSVGGGETLTPFYLNPQMKVTKVYTPKIGSREKEMVREIQTVGQRNKLLIKEKPLLQVRTKILPREDAIVKTQSKITQKETQIIKEQLKSKQLTRMAQTQVLKQKLLSRQKLTPRPRLKTPVKPVRIIIPKLLGATSKKDFKQRLAKINSFEAVGFRFGKEVSLGFGSKQEVKKSLTKFLSSTLGASGYLAKSGKKVRAVETGLLKSSSFRKSKVNPFLVVEKKSKRLKRKGTEVKEIQMFKKGSKSKLQFGL